MNFFEGRHSKIELKNKEDELYSYAKP